MERGVALPIGELELSLSYVGQDADNHELDFYDAAVALIGFQRSLALTAHFVLNNEVITQAPALKGARIFVIPPEAGSWKIKAALVAAGATALYHLGTAPKDTPIGNLVGSAYDYVVSNALGFHVDYGKTLGRQYEELKHRGLPVGDVSKQRFDAVTEKCEVAIREMHRPIVKSQTADAAYIQASTSQGVRDFDFALSRQTYDHMQLALPSLEGADFVGRVSSYNLNTFKGRIFIGDEGRPVSFEVAESARNPQTITAIARSLAANAGSRQSDAGILHFRGVPLETRTGRLQGIVLIAAA